MKKRLSYVSFQIVFGNNNKKVKNLCDYDWIIEAWKAKFKCYL